MSTSSVFVALTTSVVAPDMLFAAFKDNKTTLPLAAPNIVKTVNYIEGEGEPGTILKIVYVKGTYGKEKVELVDDKNYQFNYSVIEGDPLGDKFKKISAEIKIEPIDTPGNMHKKVSATYKIPANATGSTPASSVTLTGIYETIDNKSIDREDLRIFAKKALELLKLVERHVMSNEGH